MRMYTNRPIDDFPQAPDAFIAGRYLMRIASYTPEVAKDGRTFFKIACDILEGPTAVAANGNPIDYTTRQFTLLLWHPDASIQTVDWQLEQSERQLRQFLEGFNIPWDGTEYDPDDFPGAEAYVTLGPQKRKPEMMEPKRIESAV